MEYSFLKLTTETDKYAKDGEWFEKNGLYIASQYDRQVRRDFGVITGRAVGNAANLTTGSPNVPSTYVGGSPMNAIRIFYDYYSNTQQNQSYGYASTDTDNVSLPSVWVAGQKITELVDDAVGKQIKVVNGAKVDTKSVSPAATNRKTKQIELATIAHELKDYIGQMEQDQGVGFSPLGGMEQKFESLGDLNNYFKYDYKEKMEVMAHQIVQDIMLRNDYLNFFKDVLKNCLIGGVIATYPRVKNGKVWLKKYYPYQIIYDNKEDSEHHQNDRYIGVIEYMTPQEIISEYGEELQKTEKGRKALKTLKEITVDNYGRFVNSLPNCTLTTAMTNSTYINIAVVKAWWRADKDTRYVVRENGEYGSKYVTKIKDTDKETDNHWWETWYKCTMIADLAIVDYGEETNLVERFEDKAVVQPPICVWTPDMTMGYARSLVGRLFQLQDKIDYFENTITQYVDRSTGKNFIVRGDLLGVSPDTVVNMVNDFRRYGIHVTSTQDGDDPQSGDNVKNLIETVDMTLDPNIVNLIGLRKEQEELMQKIASTSEVDLGQQQGYISVNSQQQTISQNEKGTLSLTYGFIRHICQSLQMATNIQKNLIAEYNEGYGIPVISEDGQQYLEATKDLALEDFQIYMRFEDNITTEVRNRLLVIAERYASQPQPIITMKDIVKIEMAKNLTELMGYFDDIARKEERKQAEAQAMQAEMEAAMAQQQQQTMLATEAMKQEGEDKRTNDKIEGKLLETAMKNNSAPPA